MRQRQVQSVRATDHQPHETGTGKTVKLADSKMLEFVEEIQELKYLNGKSQLQQLKLNLH